MGSSGIGLAAAERFVKERAYVFITGRRQAELNKVAAEIGNNVTAVQGDASNLDDLDRLYEEVAKKKGKLDVLFANTGNRLQTANFARSEPEERQRQEDAESHGCGTSSPSRVNRFLHRYALLSFCRSLFAARKLTIVYHSRSQLADALRRLLAADIRLDGASDHGVSEALYLRDPDQYGVELYWDRPREYWPYDSDGQLRMYSQPRNIEELLREMPTAA